MIMRNQASDVKRLALALSLACGNLYCAQQTLRLTGAEQAKVEHIKLIIDLAIEQAKAVADKTKAVSPILLNQYNVLLNAKGADYIASIENSAHQQLNTITCYGSYSRDAHYYASARDIVKKRITPQPNAKTTEDVERAKRLKAAREKREQEEKEATTKKQVHTACAAYMKAVQAEMEKSAAANKPTNVPAQAVAKKQASTQQETNPRQVTPEKQITKKDTSPQELTTNFTNQTILQTMIDLREKAEQARAAKQLAAKPL